MFAAREGVREEEAAVTLPGTITGPNDRAAHAPFPWDTRASMVTFATTWASLLLHPRRSFGELPAHVRGRWRPFFFTLVCLLLGTVTRFLPATVLCMRELGYRLHEGTPAIAAIRTGALLVAILVLVPLGQALVRVFVLGALDLLLLRVLGAARGGVEPTLRVGCYASAPGVLHAVPYLWVMGELWQAWLRIVGYRAVHGNRGLRTLVVVLVVLLTLVAYLATHFALTANEGAIEGLQRSLGI
jgi:hypothetical protein